MEDSDGPTPPRRRRLNQSSDSLVASRSQFSDTITQVDEIKYAGRIIRVHMENIMCHSNKEVRFNPRINFITGNNGSGKSAILASLVVGLGENATVTGRFRSVKELIKMGETSGKITIEIMNEGCNEYKPDVYGPSITIVRSFTSSGSNSYQVKSANGKIISRKKDEVEKISHALNLSVKNPLCVLNQDNARTFLSVVNNSMRYSMFMRATGLEEIMQYQIQSSTTLNTTRASLQQKKTLLLETENEVKTLRKKLEYACTLNKITQERSGLENELAWSHVFDQEKAVLSIQEEKQVLKDKLEKLETDITNYQTNMNEINGKREELKEELKTVIDKKNDLERKRQDISSSCTTLRNQLEMEKPSLNTINSKSKRLDEEINRVNTFMEEMDERNEESSREYKRVVERLQQVQVELRTNIAQISQAERELENADQSKQKEADALIEIQRTIQELVRNKSHKHNQIQAMKDRSDVKMVRFGDFMPRLVEAIKANSSKFDHVPIGPLGNYIQLKSDDADWGPAVENIIGGLMTAFRCHSDKDYRILNSIMEKVITSEASPQLIIGPFSTTKHDISRNLVRVSDPNIKPVLDTLDIGNVVTFNTLVDQLRIESVVLFENDQSAAAKCTNLENVPKGLRMGVTKDCDKYFPAPNYRTYFGRKNSRYFNQNENKQQLVEKLQIDIKEIEKEVVTYHAQEGELKKTVQQLETFCSQTQQQLRDLRINRTRLERELRDCKEKEESRPPPLTRVVLEGELDLLRNQKEDCDRQVIAKTRALETISQSINEKQLLLNEINSKRDDIQMEIGKLEEDLETNENSRRSMEFMNRNAKKHMEDWNQKLIENGENQVKAQLELEEAIREAEDLHPDRINTMRTPREITKLIEEKDMYIRAASKVTGDAEALAEEFRVKRLALDDKRRSINEYEKFKDYFKIALQRRTKLFNEIRALKGQDIGYYFTVALKTRGFDGVLKFDHEDAKLDLDVQPQSDTKDRRTDVKTLSGGEKSYSTVSLILAIWRSTQMPFVAMDEFDVFMDGVNRKIVMDLLMQYAEETPNKQFIFLTPLEISMIKQNDHCAVFQMTSKNIRPGERQ